MLPILFRDIVKTRKLPLANEVLNAVFPQKSCPVRMQIYNQLCVKIIVLIT